jgi:hypothetical protein
MVTDDDCQAAEAAKFWKKLDAKVAAAVTVNKRYVTAHARVLATTVLLEEEQSAAAILTEETRAAVALIEPPSPMPPRPPPII